MRSARTICVAAAILTGLVFAGLVMVVVADPSSKTGLPDLWPASFMAMAFVGAFVAFRRPQNATGWLFLGCGFLMVGSGFAQAYGNVAYASLRNLPNAQLVAWLGFWTWLPAVVLLSLVLVVFPGGRPSPFWRWVVRLEVLVIAACCIATIPTLQAPGPVLLAASTPSDVPGGALLGVLSSLATAFIPLGFIALAIRFVRARGVERLQMKWFVFGASVLALAAGGMPLVAILLGIEDPFGHPLGSVSITIGVTAMCAAASVAILKYRLFEIDRIISRTLSYALVTVVLGGVFALSVLVPSLVLGGRKVPDYVTAGATLVVAALFRPVRRRVQNTVDHRFNRKRYDAAHTIEAFTVRLREQIDLETLNAELKDVVGRTMQPSQVSVWLRADGKTV